MCEFFDIGVRPAILRFAAQANHIITGKIAIKTRTSRKLLR